MAYHIYGESDTFATSNSGGEWLVNSLVAVADRPGERDLSGVALLLRRTEGYFRLHPVKPAALDGPGPLTDLAELIARVACELCRERPRLPDTDYYRELRLRWVAQMVHLHDMVRAAIRPASAAPDAVRPPLSPRDEREVEVQRWRVRRYHAARGPLEEALALEDTILALQLRQPPSPERDYSIALDYRMRVWLLEKRGLESDPRYLDALRQSLRFERDEEMREAIQEVLAGTDRSP